MRTWARLAIGTARLGLGAAAASLALLAGGAAGLVVVNGGPTAPNVGYVAYPLQACAAPATTCERPTFPPPDYPRNAAGQTYGPERLARGPEELPDLVATKADNGRWGYLRRAEADAASMRSSAPKRLFVYARDGRTIIGVHELIMPTVSSPADVAQMRADLAQLRAGARVVLREPESVRPPLSPSTSAR